VRGWNSNRMKLIQHLAVEARVSRKRSFEAITRQYPRVSYGLAICLSAAGILCGCHTLPSDFGSRPLTSKIAAYERWIAETGRPNTHAQHWISWHGTPAADAMVQYLTGQRTGLPKSEALYILWDIQLRGCSLRGTSVEAALAAYTTNRLRPRVAEVELAQKVLRCIADDCHISKFDDLPPGACGPNE
jgi:hypothetical protein